MLNQPRGTCGMSSIAALAASWQVRLQNSPDWPFHDGLSHPLRAHVADAACLAGAEGAAPMAKHWREQNPGRPSKVGLPQPGRPQIGTAGAAGAVDGAAAPIARQAREQNSFGFPLKVGLLQPARAHTGRLGV
eukprot:Skav232100  [mRNA]  locus=scaffold2353:97741:99438:- [translate_table: standard]